LDVRDFLCRVHPDFAATLDFAACHAAMYPGNTCLKTPNAGRSGCEPRLPKAVIRSAQFFPVRSPLMQKPKVLHHSLAEIERYEAYEGWLRSIQKAALRVKHT